MKKQKKVKAECKECGEVRTTTFKFLSTEQVTILYCNKCNQLTNHIPVTGGDFFE